VAGPSTPLSTAFLAPQSCCYPLVLTARSRSALARALAHKGKVRSIAGGINY